MELEVRHILICKLSNNLYIDHFPVKYKVGSGWQRREGCLAPKLVPEWNEFETSTAGTL